MRSIINVYTIGALILLGLIFFPSCQSPVIETADESLDISLEPGPNTEEEAQGALIEVEEGEVIEFGEGTFNFTKTLTMDGKSKVTIVGQGREKTIFSFKDQNDGGDGLLITNSDNIVVRDLTILDAAGDALKFRNSDSIVMAGIGTVWSGEPSEENGAYGLYPVLSSNILIEDCYCYGASDSGIYVGQSDKAIVRDCEAEGNVAGIEIENTTNADVYDNYVHDNAAGILVFDLPGLSQAGARTRVFDNRIINNLRGNFAHEGHIVAEVPAGTGILVLSTDEVEIFDNTFEENNVMGTMVASYQSLVALGRAPEPPSDYEPFPEQIYIHDNSFSRSNTYPAPEEQSFFGNLLVQSFESNSIPDLLLDGVFAPGTGESGTICIEENEGNSFVNLNLATFPNDLSFNQSPHNCSLEPLPEVTVDVPDF